MRRGTKIAALLAATTLVILAAVSAASGSTTSTRTTNITIWVYFSNPELTVVKNVIAQFEKTHPSIHVTVVGGVSDQKILAAIRGGNAPDVAQSGSSDNTGEYCGTGAWINLNSYMQKDHVSANLFPSAPRYYTQINGTRCALPMLADAYGLYYNKTLFKQAGIAHPPRTISELTADAKKLTQRNKDGSLKVVGFDPFNGWYENAAAHYAPLFGAKWIDGKGNSTLATSPGWTKYMNWEKSLIDWYGYSNLVRFQAGAGDEFAPSNAFERAKVAMNLDGEWRVSFLARSTPSCSTASHRPQSTTRSHSSTAPATRRAASSASRRRRSTRTRRGSSSSTSRRTTSPRRRSRTGSSTYRRRAVRHTRSC